MRSEWKDHHAKSSRKEGVLDFDSGLKFVTLKDHVNLADSKEEIHGHGIDLSWTIGTTMFGHLNNTSQNQLAAMRLILLTSSSKKSNILQMAFHGSRIAIPQTKKYK